MSIHDEIVKCVCDTLYKALITDHPDVVNPDLTVTIDPAKAGVVILGPLQGDPDPDAARISVTIHENDPDAFYGAVSTGMKDSWEDEVAEVECGGSMTWKRRFTVKARCLLVNTQEDLAYTRAIASTVRSRIEKALLGFSGTGISDTETGEYVSMGVFSGALKGEMVQAGGPPDAYDYLIKVRFELQTTIGVSL